jgi:hypothetical protein
LVPTTGAPMAEAMRSVSAMTRACSSIPWAWTSMK